MRRWLRRLTLLLLFLIGVSATAKWWSDGARIQQAQTQGWHQLNRGSAQLLPEASDTDAHVMVLAASTYGWRGYFATHPWIILKEQGQTGFERYEVIRWGGGNSVVRRNRSIADGHWFGAEPQVLARVSGEQAQALIKPIRQAIQSYPYHGIYRTYPGPNSNTFLAHIGREVPALALDLPPTSIGKDYRPIDDPIGRPPSGQGLQISLAGVLGLIVSPEEGLELNILGLGFGIDFNCYALRLPFVGRLGLSGWVLPEDCLPPTAT